MSSPPSVKAGNLCKYVNLEYFKTNKSCCKSCLFYLFPWLKYTPTCRVNSTRVAERISGPWAAPVPGPWALWKVRKTKNRSSPLAFLFSASQLLKNADDLFYLLVSFLRSCYSATTRGPLTTSGRAPHLLRRAPAAQPTLIPNAYFCVFLCVTLRYCIVAEVPGPLGICPPTPSRRVRTQRCSQ